MLRMLIVDENALSRALQSRVFMDRGYVCSIAGTAREARREASAFRPDVVLFDWVFRDGSGVGLAQKLRENAAASRDRLQIVALSVWEEPFDFSAREGIDIYYVKPTSLIEIDRAIRIRLRPRDR